MHLKGHPRRKDAKEHRFWSLLEKRRVGGGKQAAVAFQDFDGLRIARGGKFNRVVRRPQQFYRPAQGCGIGAAHGRCGGFASGGQPGTALRFLLRLGEV